MIIVVFVFSIMLALTELSCCYSHTLVCLPDLTPRLRWFSIYTSDIVLNMLWSNLTNNGF